MNHICKCCGKSFTPTCHNTRQIFCSSECRIKYHNSRRYAPPNEQCAHCGKTIDKKISRGKNRKYCSDGCRIAHNVEKAKARKRKEREKPRVCPYCGKEFTVLWEKGGLARFCSDECRISWWKEYNKGVYKQNNTTCAYCGKEITEGKYCSRACYRLGSAQLRGEKRCDWCGKLLSKKAHSNQKYCSSSCAAQSRNHSTTPMRRSITTNNPDAWRLQLKELAKNVIADKNDNIRILLVCEKARLTSTDALVGIIRYDLNCDPFDGNIYVFCNKDCTQLKWLNWDNSGFCVGFRVCEWGKYPWPKNSPKKVMEITRQEYNFLVSKSIR